jgi:hypothetical protein
VRATALWFLGSPAGASTAEVTGMGTFVLVMPIAVQ